MASGEVTQDDFDYHVSDQHHTTNQKARKATGRSDGADQFDDSMVGLWPQKVAGFPGKTHDVNMRSVDSEDRWRRQGRGLLDPAGSEADLSDDEDIVDSILGWLQVTFKTASKRSARRWCWAIALLQATLSSVCIVLLVTMLTNVGRDPGQHHQSRGSVASTISGWEEIEMPTFQAQSQRQPRSDLLPPSHAPPPPPPPLPCAPGFASAIQGHYECVQLSLEHPQRCASMTSLASQDEAKRPVPEQGAERRARSLSGSPRAAKRDSSGQQSDVTVFSSDALGGAGLLQDDARFDRRLDAASTFDPELILRCSHMCMFSAHCTGFSILRIALQESRSARCFMYSHFEGPYLADSASMTCVRRMQ